MLVHVVDDSAINCEIFAAVAERIAPDVRVATFTDPKDGLVAAGVVMPDLVVLDFMMPEIDGHEYARRFRAMPGAKAVPIVMITAATDRAIRHAALEIGVTDFLTKPIDRQEMRARLSNLLALRRAHLNLQDRSRWLAEEVRKATEQVLHQANHDMLTGLPNRTYFLRQLEQSLGSTHFQGESMAVLYLDLDGFKDVNDLHGHAAGDTLLMQVAQRMLAEVQPGDTLARIGGDEFVLLLTRDPLPERASAIATRVIEALRRPFEVEGSRIEVGVSVGIALYPQDGADADALMRAADAAMYRVKQEERGAVRFYEAAMNAQLQARLQLERELTGAVERGELVLHYQPIVNGATGEVETFEALVRWHHPERGMVPPIAFIPLAEATGLIDGIGRWVIDTACREAAGWPYPWRVSINISPRQFRHTDICTAIDTALAANALHPSRVVVEVTEGILIEDTSKAVTILNRLRSMGVRVALDDFGTGYSSLSYLQLFKFDKFKIDKSFVQRLGESDEALTITRTIVNLGHNLGLLVTAEGVETLEQLRTLQSFGCDQIQGYFVARPAPIEAFTNLDRLRIIAAFGSEHPRLSA